MPRPKSEDPRTDHHFRANREEIRALDTLATRLGVCRSAAIRWAVANAVPPGNGEERSCFTCGWADYKVCRHPASDIDGDIDQYALNAGCAKNNGGMPTDRTIQCPGWKAKENV